MADLGHRYSRTLYDEGCILFPHFTSHMHTPSCAGAIANLVFLSLHSWLGYGSFLVFAAIAFAGGIYCAMVVPETKGRTLAEVQALLSGAQGSAPDASAAGALAWCSVRQL